MEKQTGAQPPEIKKLDEKQKELILKAFQSFKKKLIIVSPDFDILFCNSAKPRDKEAECVGEKCHEFFYGHDRPCEDCAVVDAIRKKSPELKQIPGKFLKTDMMACQYAYPIRLPDGEVEAFVSMKFDLRIQEKLEKKFNRANSFLRNLINSAVDGVVGADKKGNILIFSEVAERISGYSAREAMSSLNIRDIYPEGVASDIMKKMRGEEYGGPGKLRQCHVDCIGKNGVIAPISLNASIVYENGKEAATIGFFHDRREELEIKRKLEKTRIQLLQAEKMSSLGKLSAGVAHQLNNPLGSIMLFARLILEEHELEESAQDDLKRILEDAERCRNIVKELLEFARQTNYKMGPCDVNKALSRTLFLLENQTVFHNIAIGKEFFPDLPKIMANEQQLNHVFMNIILNAAQAMEGKGSLDLSTDFIQDRDVIEIRISDSGPGIPDDIVSSIFDPFFTTKEEGKGTGLGLSLVYGIVKKHGGTVSAESGAGGTTFIIRFPVLRERKGNDKENEIG